MPRNKISNDIEQASEFCQGDADRSWQKADRCWQILRVLSGGCWRPRRRAASAGRRPVGCGASPPGASQPGTGRTGSWAADMSAMETTSSTPEYYESVPCTCWWSHTCSSHKPTQPGTRSPPLRIGSLRLGTGPKHGYIQYSSFLWQSHIWYWITLVEDMSRVDPPPLW